LNFLSKLLNALGVKDVRPIEMHTAKQLVLESSPPEFEIAFENFERHKSPDAGPTGRAV
jgi:hypothetical protein